MTAHPRLNAKCPWCGKDHTNVTPVSGEKMQMPGRGDVTLCIGCGEWSEFDETSAMVKPSDETLMGLAQNAEAQAARKAWVQMNGATNNLDVFKERMKAQYEAVLKGIWQEILIAEDYGINRAFAVTEVNFLAAKIAGSVLGNTIGDRKLLDTILPALIKTMRDQAHTTQEKKLAAQEAL